MKAVQAGAASEEATTDPAREALGLIQQTSRQVLAELRKVVQPTRQELITYTVVVFVFVLAVIPALLVRPARSRTDSEGSK